MSDNKDRQGRHDDLRIDRNDPGEMAYASQDFGVSESDIIEAMKATGSDYREDIAHWLAGRVRE